MAVLPITAVENLPCVETDFDNLTSPRREDEALVRRTSFTQRKPR